MSSSIKKEVRVIMWLSLIIRRGGQRATRHKLHRRAPIPATKVCMRVADGVFWSFGWDGDGCSGGCTPGPPVAWPGVRPKKIAEEVQKIADEE